MTPSTEKKRYTNEAEGDARGPGGTTTKEEENPYRREGGNGAEARLQGANST